MPESANQTPPPEALSLRGWVYVIFVVTSCLVLLGVYQDVEQRFPRYYMWDIDLTTTADVLLLTDGEIPGSFAHPARGMYWFQGAALWINHRMGGVSLGSAEGLQTAIQPFWAASEVTTFLRSLSPVAALLLVLFLWQSVVINLRLPDWLKALMLLTAGTLPCIAFNVASIRSEMFAVFYWFIAFLLLRFAFSTVRVWPHLMLSLSAGIALGLCYMSKTQSIATIVLFGIFVILLHELRERDLPTTDLSRVGRSLTLCHGIANLLFFLLLFLKTNQMEIPKEYITFADFEGTTIFGKIFSAGYLSLALLAIIVAWGQRWSKPFTAIAVALNCVASGFLIAYLTHFIFAKDFSTGLNHLLFTFRVQLWGKSNLAIAGNVRSFGELLSYPYAEKLATLFARHGVVMGFFLGSGILLLATKTLGLIRLRWSALAWLSLTYLLLFASFVLANRLQNKDDIFFHPFAIGMTCFASALVVHNYIGRRVEWIQGFLALALTVLTIWQFRDFRDSIDRETADDWILTSGYHEARFTRGVFPAQGPYSAIDDRIPGNQERLRINADRTQIYKNAAMVTFPKQPVSLLGLGAAFPNFFLWQSEPNTRLTEVPQPFLGAVVVDPTHFIATDNRLTVNVRRDYHTILMLSGSDVPAFTPAPPSTEWTTEIISVNRNGTVIPYRALVLQNGVRSINIGQIREPFFFLMIRR